MKSIRLVAMIVVLAMGSYSELSAQNYHSTGFQPLVIDQNDSVIFDVAQAINNATTVEFSIRLKSDDVINALDFAFKYDHSHLEYDTIFNLTNYIEALSYYNTVDSTIRLTSYSFTQPYTNDTPLVKVRFIILSGQLCASDLDSVSALLNGDASGLLVTDCTIGVNEIKGEDSFNIYPNPASDKINIEAEAISLIEIYDIESKRVYDLSFRKEIGEASILTDNLKNGSYFVRVISDKNVLLKKFIVAR